MFVSLRRGTSPAAHARRLGGPRFRWLLGYEPKILPRSASRRARDKSALAKLNQNPQAPLRHP